MRVHLAVDGGIERGEPFVVHDQRLNFSLGELGDIGRGLWRRAPPRLA